MAFPTVTHLCLDGEHASCSKRIGVDREEVEHLLLGEIRCGGGFCICPCHGVIPADSDWYAEVKAQSILARAEGWGLA